MNNSDNKNKLVNRRRKGLSLAEMLMMMIVTCVIIVATLPILSKAKIVALQRKGIDLNTVNCVIGGSTSASSCSASLYAAKYGDPNVMNTLQYFINNSTSTTFALQMMRLSCDNLSVPACDYFINSCIADTSTTRTNSCNIPTGPSSTYNLNYYLTSTISTSVTTSPNFYIANRVNYYCSQKQQPIYEAVMNACSNGPSSSIACQLEAKNCYLPCQYFGTAAQVQNVYTKLYNVGQQILQSYGTSSFVGLAGSGGYSWPGSDKKFMQLFSPYYSTTRVCSDGNALSGNCWENTVYELSGQVDVDTEEGNFNYQTMDINDGSFMQFWDDDPQCQYSWNTFNNLCGFIIVDLNGMNPPNQVGKDIFFFLVTSTGILADGTSNSWGAGDCTPGSTSATQYGEGCAQQMLNLANRQPNTICPAF